MVITVFDPAGNTDRTVWNLEVNAAPSTSTSGGLIAAGVGLLVVVAAVVVVLRLRRIAPVEQNPAPVPTAEESAEQAKAAEMASIYGSAQPQSATVQPAMAPTYPAPTSPVALDEMAQSLLGDRAAEDAGSMAGFEALVEAAEEEPIAVFNPVQDNEVSAAQGEEEVAAAPALSTASSGGRLELPAGLVDMLEAQTDGPQ